jgi:molybdopterin guanine dinucleotide-containing S/N-oxide reductase-like protein
MQDSKRNAVKGAGMETERKISIKADKTVLKSLSLGGVTLGGVPCAVDVKDGKIVRIRPLHYDWKYDAGKFSPWKFSRNGKTYTPALKSSPGPFSLAYKKRAYSPNRIKYPLKRVDWDPNGERNTLNRGKSKYRRISWDEAAELVAAELKRVQKTYGPYAVLAQGDGHAECKTVHAPHGCQTMLLNKMGGYTQQIRNPDSWEGWYWGAKHVWGSGAIGLMAPADNIINDITENCDMILFWGCDQETTTWVAGQHLSAISYFWTEAGIKQVYICPEVNYAAAVHADKWIPVLPNTDAALQLAIIFVWITEGNYDKDYVDTHTLGFDKVKDYVTGEEDGIPKTPAWAAPKCGVPEWTIKALAREFAAKTTTIAHYFGGGMIRGPYAHEPGRLEVVLLGMQGLGKPGVHQAPLTSGMPRTESAPHSQVFLGRDAEDMHRDRIHSPHDTTFYVKTRQHIPKTLLQEAILNPPITYWGTGAIRTGVEDQFVKYTYPIPKEEGGTEIHMIWTDTPCRTTCWNDGMQTLKALRDPKIECIVAQHPWLENDCLIADIILPSNTTFEVADINKNDRGGILPSVTLQRQAILPIGESKSDYEVVLEVAKKLGLYEEITCGKSVDEWIKAVFDNLDLNHRITWEELEEKEYFVFPTIPDWKNDTPGLRKFYEDPEKNPLQTPSGKLEFYSERLEKYFPGDVERPPTPKWIEKGETHNERISSERAQMFPLLMMSNHGRWRVHSQCDDISWTREALTGKVKGWDGYMYEPLWINPLDAAKRGIRQGDIVKACNERGTVLCGALVWERIMPGAVYVDHGARTDFIIPGQVDRGGAINLISPRGLTSKRAGGQATSGYLVEVEKLTLSEMQAWQRDYPEAFEREYDPASGLRFNGWVEDDSKI